MIPHKILHSNLNLHSNFLPFCFLLVFQNMLGEKSHPSTDRPATRFKGVTASEDFKGVRKKSFLVWAVKKDVFFSGGNEKKRTVSLKAVLQEVVRFCERNLIWSARHSASLRTFKRGVVMDLCYVIENSTFLSSGWLRSESSIKGYEVQVYRKSWQTTI